MTSTDGKKRKKKQTTKQNKTKQDQQQFLKSVVFIYICTVESPPANGHPSTTATSRHQRPLYTFLRTHCASTSYCACVGWLTNAGAVIAYLVLFYCVMFSVRATWVMSRSHNFKSIRLFAQFFCSLGK